LRIDPEQRFSCSQCGRCCHRFEVVVSAAEIDLYRRRNATAWFRENAGTDEAARDPFEALPGMPGIQRIRKRADGACGFLSADNRCRIHEELGAAKKPLTCRLFPYAFRPAVDGVVVTASFGCPTIVANEGPLIAAGDQLAAIESLRKEWFSIPRPASRPLDLVRGRSMESRSLQVLRHSLLAMLKSDGSLRTGLARIATVLDDLTRSRVLALKNEDFAEYVSLTVPHAAKNTKAPDMRRPGVMARWLQYGFLYAVTAIRADLEHAGQSRMQLRMTRLRLLAHFHGLAPGLERVRVGALKQRRVDIDDPEIRPVVFHYLRSTLETLGAQGRPVIDELSIAVSYLNAACAMAVMNADAAGKTIDRDVFSEALIEASDVSHARNVLLDWALSRLSGGTDAVWYLAS
jgi:Fe-S-cluster containining protein